jgi:hypothetical protein
MALAPRQSAAAAWTTPYELRTQFGHISRFGIDFLRGMYGVAKEANMPGDPKECRERARQCAELACTAETPEARSHFASLTRSWISLAAELEGAEAFINAVDRIAASDEAASKQSAPPKAA